ncbi:MAG: hypothetical protein IJY74_00295, partial [Oscillospiraceae bacterium]|nr:hypothetical protein [Oscillospiraceae bacterium]
KPNYAMRLASIITAAGSLAGCNSMQLQGETSVVDTEPATTDVEFMGAIEPATEETAFELDGDVVCDPDETDVVIDGDFIIIEEETANEPAVTTTDDENIAVPGMSIVETEETTPVTNNRKKPSYTTAPASTEVEIDGMITTATEKKTTAITEITTMTTTEVSLDGTVPMYTQATTRELADAGVVTTYTEATTTTEPELAGDIPIPTETTATEVTTAGVIPIYTETTTELELAGEPVLPME